MGKRLCRDPSRRGQDGGKFTEQLGMSHLRGQLAKCRALARRIL
jgi:hypothetical protein